VATEQNSTLVMPIPIELLSLFGARPAGDPGGNGRPIAPAPPPSPSSGPSPGPEEGRPPEQGNGRAG
jgi:hypothetical protein